MRSQIHRFLSALSIMFAFATLAPAQEWYDHYERGVAALRRGQPIIAAQALQRAIQKNPTPGENVSTFGSNRLAQYYPYLRLAEALAMAGEHDLARRALARSETFGREPAAERATVLRLLNEARKPGDRAAAPVVPEAAAPTPTATATQTPEPTAVPEPTRAVVTKPVATPTRVIRENTTPIPPPAAQVSATPSELTATPPLPTTTPAQTGAGGTIEIATAPGAVDIYLNDEFIGRTDPSGKLVKRDVPAGKHEIRTGAPTGFVEAKTFVEMPPGGTKSVAFALKSAEASGSSFLLWAGIGLGIAVLGGLAWFVARSRANTVSGGATLSVPTTQRARTPPSSDVAANTVSTGASPSQAQLKTAAPPKSAASVTSPSQETHALNTGAARAGSVFGDYRLVRELGKGGMAVVFLAEKNGEQVALKRPLAAYLGEAEFIERFVREAEIGRTLNHPNIIHILDKGQVGQIPYFTMELVKGETLHALLKREGSLSARRATTLLKNVAEALDYAHMKGVIHRDLKPSNIMVLESGIAKVMDYGIARSARLETLTATGAFLGTPEYIAPETAEGGTTDARSDLYALGVIYYEMVTGLRPFVGDTPFATLRKHCTEPPRPPSEVRNCPDEVEAVILKLLSKHPSHRYPSAEDLLLELNTILDKAVA